MRRVSLLLCGAGLLCAQLRVEPVNDAADLFSCDKSCALKLTLRAFVARAPEKIFVVKVLVRAVPAAAAAVAAEHPLGGIKFGVWQAETADEHHRYLCRPGKPGEAAGQTNKEAGVPEQVDPRLQRQRAGKVLGAPGNVVPDETVPCGCLTVDAQHPVAQ